MPKWLRVLVFSSILLFCTILGGVLGAWLPARGTEHDTGAAGAADGMEMILFGLLGLSIGFFVGLIGALILNFQLTMFSMARTEYVTPSGEDVWPPPPTRPLM